MNIRPNINALRASNNISRHKRTNVSALDRVTTGKRISQAADDVGGLSVSADTESRGRSLNMAQRNINDALSMLLMADANMHDAFKALTRGKELSIQANNDIYSSDNLTDIQTEVTEIINQLDSMAATVEFNGIAIMQGGADSREQDIFDALEDNWLQGSLERIQSQYGIAGGGATLKVGVSDLSSGTLAQVSGSYYVSAPGNAASPQTMLIDPDLVLATNLPDGGPVSGLSKGFYSDRVIAHELVHATMGVAMNYSSIDVWFKEGAAEFIHGGDERLESDISNQGSFAGVVSQDITNWDGSSAHYSAGYTAVRYMNNLLNAAATNAQGTTGGIKEFMTYMSADTDRTFDAAVSHFFSSGGLVDGGGNDINVTTADDFVTRFQANVSAIGDADISLDAGDESDTGLAGGADADGGASTDAESAVSNSALDSNDFSTFFNFSFDTATSLTAQVGETNSSHSYDLSSFLADVRSATLGVSDVDVTSGAAGAITTFDTAMDTLSEQRSSLGAAMLRLESMLSQAQDRTMGMEESNVKIVDADMARALTDSTRSQMLMEGGVKALDISKLASQNVISLIG
jgi:flagellin